MKKLLYITVNSKPENESASKMVGRRLVNQIKQPIMISNLKSWTCMRFMSQDLNPNILSLVTA